MIRDQIDIELQGENDSINACKVNSAGDADRGVTLLLKLRNAEERAEKEGWISADDLEKELGIYLDSNTCNNSSV